MILHKPRKTLNYDWELANHYFPKLENDVKQILKLRRWRFKSKKGEKHLFFCTVIRKSGHYITILFFEALNTLEHSNVFKQKYLTKTTHQLISGYVNFWMYQFKIYDYIIIERVLVWKYLLFTIACTYHIETRDAISFKRSNLLFSVCCSLKIRPITLNSKPKNV